MKLVILTGAGISQESGLRTFRGNDGLWENERIEDVATPEGYERDPLRVKNFYNGLRASLPNFLPNKAHKVLALLEEKWKGDFLLITQNVDDLHERAGSKNIIHMHGELLKLRCEKNPSHVFPFHSDETENTQCPFCGSSTRPHIVWFGEIPLQMEAIGKALSGCENFVYIGTSSTVYPAAGFKRIARANGARVTCLNLEAPQNDFDTDIVIAGKATEVVPAWAENFR